ncbi:MAG: hypothetical protein DMG43_12980 [Acidobacteria bacterium]|nr:MAG: hypothetical protein DMG43_12980 [Acidobacteriota bacterium]
MGLRQPDIFAVHRNGRREKIVTFGRRLVSGMGEAHDQRHIPTRIGFTAIDSSPAYVVTEALKLLFKRDEEFKSWLGQHTNNHNLNQIEGGSLTEIAKKA